MMDESLSNVVDAENIHHRSDIMVRTIKRNFLEPQQKVLKDIERTDEKCECKISSNTEMLLGWELYKPRSHYINSNEPTKPSSTAVLRHLLNDGGRMEILHGRPTALTRLAEQMCSQPSKPKFNYGNCLQQTFTFDENRLTYKYAGDIQYVPPSIDDVYFKKEQDGKKKRKNPFAHIQMCPMSLYDFTRQPAGQEYVRRADSLIDPLNL